jgi:UDP-2,4-diacetamido-2,4,6-trideoxy-beta-L-altropyranose hydrolase
MKCVFRVDASIDVGTGHVMRCRTLANTLKIRGADVHFITRAHQGHLGDMLSTDGFSVTLLPQPNNSEIKGFGYAAWMGVSQQEDALQTIHALENQVCDWLIVDHYALDHTWEEQIRMHTRKLMAIDDLANRNHLCDVLLDQSYAVEGESRYRPRMLGPCQLLLGPRYALLRPEYAQYRETMAKRSGDIKRVLVFMGGGDNHDITGKVLAALNSDRLAHLEVDVVIGANFSHKFRIVEQATARPNTQIHGMRPHLADLMVRADFAIGAGGATTWERLCMGLPSAVISIAENQVPTCKALASNGLIQYLGEAHDLEVSDIEMALFNVLTETGQLRGRSGSNQVLVDGLGASRVAEALVPTKPTDLMLRSAYATDALTYFVWANDPVVRSSANNSEQIDLITHLQWFYERLNNKNSCLYVLEACGLPIGQVRFDLNVDEATIDYSLDVLVRGRGLAKQLLMLGISKLTSKRQIIFKASVKPENIASAATFARLGFVEGVRDEENGNLKFILDTANLLNKYQLVISGEGEKWTK